MNALLSSKPETEPETGTKRGAEAGTETESAVRGAEPTGTGAHDARRIPATPAAPGPLASFARFVLCGGGTGVLSSLAVPLVAGLMPWAVANAVITVASTILCTELHARFTFGSGKHAGWREHWQSAGSAAVAYAVTSVAILILHTLQTSPSMLTEQLVYLSASGLAGIGRFLLLRLYVFTGGRTRATEPVRVNSPAPRPYRALAWA
ncbi:GtrA family protein [Streptomyces mirabilis]|uniref:GtrA family protein n=1 Tax=Streptomyces mirabilis TaxID=68239 RepID=UPI0036DBA97A